ncbi:MAG: hypothetical protein IT158_19180 [Bryobacterales bacterium]|nr:hypothetical protein [Bryobacterales bacterium]
MTAISRRGFLCASGAPLLLKGAPGRHPDLPDADFDFRTFFVTWGDTTTPAFYRFLEEVRPEMVQAGFYGPLFHGYADNPASTGYMMRLPVAGQREALAAQRRVNDEIHRRGLKVAAHFQIINVIQKGGGRENNFAEFYEKHWHEDILGPRPHPDWRELMLRDASGNPLVNKHYVDYHGLCVNSPYARQLLRRMLDVALDAGVDGIMSNYNYRWDCVCPHCQAEFKSYLAGRFKPEELKKRFGIADLAAHRFERIAGVIPGMPKPGSPELDWEAMHWAARNFKRRWDELLIGHGRRRKPDLILAQWNHLGDMNAGEERAFTPVDEWGRGENYFWYSGGYGPTRLAERKAGEAWLDCLWLREMCGWKPFMMGKYENIRMRNTIAEGVATGGSGMGLQIQFTNPAGYEAAARYLRFVRDHRDLYDRPESWAEVGLIYPRSAVWNRHPEAVDGFRAIGHALVDHHVLFDVVWDQKMTAERLARYAVIVAPGAQWLSEKPRALLAAHESQGNVVLRLDQAEPVLADTGRRGLSKVDAPWTLRVAGYSRPGRRILHFVNYNRDEEKGAAIKGPAGECALPVARIDVDLRLPDRRRVRAVRLLSPDPDILAETAWKQEGGRLRFQLPRVEVYTLAEILYS